MKLPADRQLLRICQQIAAVGIVLSFVVLFGVITFGWRGYILNYPNPITDTVPSRFPVIAWGHTSREVGMGTHELITWEEWKRRQTEGTASVWIVNRTFEGQKDRESRRPLFYTYRMTELAPERYLIHVTVTDRDDLEMRAQYRVEGNHVVPLTFVMITEPTMALGVAPLSLILTVLLFWSLRKLLRWYTRHTGGEHEIRELLSQARLTLSLLVGYYLFLAIQRVAHLSGQGR